MVGFKIGYAVATALKNLKIGYQKNTPTHIFIRKKTPKNPLKQPSTSLPFSLSG